MANRILDFDGDPIKLGEDAYLLSRDAQTGRNDQYKRDYHQYVGYRDMTQFNPDAANVVIPKLASIVDTKVPIDMRAVFSRRPYIPFESQRPEFKEIARYQSKYMDELLYKAGLYEQAVMLAKLKTIYGTAFLEVLPYFENITEKVVVPVEIGGMQIGQEVQEQVVPRLRLSLRVWAPWEIYVDPFATNLTAPDGCRWLVKLQLASRRQLIKMAEKGAYGQDFDVEALKADKGLTNDKRGDHFGMQMLTDMGLVDTGDDQDMGILLRYESPDRYFDIWDGRMVLRDGDNPFKHGRINMVKLVHMVDPHTQNPFWGLGEAKRVEILADMVNDIWNMTLDNHQLMNQGGFYYRENGVDPSQLVRTPGNRIKIKSAMGDKPINQIVQEFAGTGLPSDHYKLGQQLEDFIDLAVGLYDVGRGESTKGTNTLGEVSFLKEAGDSRQELNVRLWESFLSEVHFNVSYTLDQFSTPDDHQEVLGEEALQIMAFVSSLDIPGGHNFTYKGADSVTNRLVKQRNWQELAGILMQIPNTLQGKLAVKLLEVYDEDTVDAQQMIIPDEQLFQMQAEQAEQEAAEEAEKGEVSHDRDMEKQAARPQGRPRPPGGNEVAQQAQEAGRIQSSGVRNGGL